MLGTAFQARDLMQLVDALQEDGMLRYWGTQLQRTVKRGFAKKD
jgi:hypothetical protein